MKICSSHQDYQVPLVSTMAWNYSEYWCPYCDKHEGMMGAGENVGETEELEKRGELYKKATEEYRHAIGVLVCVSTEWKGVQTKPEDLPQEEKDRLAKLRTWKLNVKAEDLK